MLKKMNLFQKKEGSFPSEEGAVQMDEPKEEEDAFTGANEGGIPEEEPINLFQIPETLQNEKEVMDLVLSVEQMAHYHHVNIQQMNELKNRLQYTTEKLNEQLSEKERFMSIIKDRERMIDSLESKVSEENLKFDQFMEEYNNMKFQLNNQIEKLKNIIDVEQKKYSTFNEKYEEEILEWINKTKKKDDKILKLQSENTNLKEQNEQMNKDNKYLLKTVNDFTSRMSMSFMEPRYSEDNEGKGDK